MKELKLLSEDWKGEIDYSGVEIIIRNGTLYQVEPEKQHDLDFIKKCYAEDTRGSRFYGVGMTALNKIDLAPEPRPADSIKLSECNGRHLIVCNPLPPESYRIVPESIAASYRPFPLIIFRREGVNWQGRDLNGIAQYPTNAYLTVLMTHVSTENIKVYDVTED